MYIFRKIYHTYLTITIFPYFQFLMRRILRKYSTYITGRVLDIGCGDKPYRKLFIETSSYTGTNSEDYYRDNIMFKPSSEDVIVNDGCDLPFGDNSFDSVLNFQVLPVFKDMNLFFRETGRVLKPGGYFLLTSDFLYPLWNKPYNFWRASSFGLNYLAESNGYEVIRIEPFGGYWIMSSRVFHKYLVRQLANFIQRFRLENNIFLKFIKFVRILLWLPVSLLIPVITNLTYLLFHIFDRLARDEDFTTNYLILMRKRVDKQ